MRRSKEEVEEIEEIEEIEELDEKALKKKKREEGKEKRKKAKKLDKAARWSGAILLFVIMLVGFLMWISGELSSGSTKEMASPSMRPVPSSGKVIVR